MVFTKPIAPCLVALMLFLISDAASALVQRSWGVGIMSWPEEVQISDMTGRGFDSTVQFYTPSVHFGQRTNRRKDGILYEAYLFYGKADVQAGNGLTYFQKRVPVYGFGGAIGWYFRPSSRQVNIGLSLPLQFRRADWTEPPTGGSVSNKDRFALGAVLDARWRLTKDLAINQRVGGFLGHKSALWMINVEWTL